MIEEVGFVDIEISDAVDTFDGAGGEAKARAFEVFGYSFLARKPLDDASDRGDAQ